VIDLKISINKDRNLITVVYDSYVEFKNIGKPPHFRYEPATKIWQQSIDNLDVDSFIEFCTNNKDFIHNYSEIVSLLGNQATNDYAGILISQRGELYIPATLVESSEWLQSLTYGDKVARKGQNYYRAKDSYATREIIRMETGIKMPPFFTGIEAPDVEQYIPDFLYPHQVDGVKWIVEKYYAGLPGVLLADDMGLGKTIQSVCAFTILQKLGRCKKLMIMAPKSTITNTWQHEVSKFFGLNLQILDTDNMWLIGSDSVDYCITNYEALAYYGRENARASLNSDWLLILDEATKFKNRDSQVYESIAALRGSAFVISLSGTPFENNASEFWAILQITAKNFMPRYLLSRRFIEYETVTLGRKTINRIVGSKNLHVFNQLAANFVLRRVKDSVVCLPKRSIHVIQVDPNELQLELIEHVKNYMFDKFKDDDITKMASSTLIRRIEDDPRLLIMGDSDVKDEPFVKRIRLEDVGPKLKVLADLLKTLKGSTVIFTQFEDMATLIKEYLTDYDCKVITGQVSQKGRNTIIEQFRTDNGVLIATDALAYGVNLQFAENLINFDLPWNPARRAQRIDRIYRLGVTEERHVWDLVCNNVEAIVYNKLIKKLRDFTVAVEGLEFEDSSVYKQIIDELF